MWFNLSRMPRTVHRQATEALAAGALAAHHQAWLEHVIGEEVWGIVVLVAVCAVATLSRYEQAEYDAKFRCPLVPLLPCAGIWVNTHLILGLPSSALVRLVVWTAAGTALYCGYGMRHSKLERPR